MSYLFLDLFDPKSQAGMCSMRNSPHTRAQTFPSWNCYALTVVRQIVFVCFGGVKSDLALLVSLMLMGFKQAATKRQENIMKVI